MTIIIIRISHLHFKCHPGLRQKGTKSLEKSKKWMKKSKEQDRKTDDELGGVRNPMDDF